MEENSLPIKDIPESVLKVVVELYGRQDALMNMVVDYLMKKGANESDLMKTFYEDCESAKADLMNELYAEYGHTPAINVLVPDES